MPGPPHPCLALSAYVDDRLPAWRRAVLERHLAGCTRCAVEVAQIRSLRALLAAPEVPEPPPELRARLLALGEQQAPSAGPVGPVGPAEHTPRDHSFREHSFREPRSRTAVGAVGVLVAGVVLVGAAGAGAVVTSSTPWPGASTRASLSTVVPRLWSWQSEPVGAESGGAESGAAEPGGAESVRSVDNGARP